MIHKNKQQEELSTITKLLELSNEYGLTCEVILTLINTVRQYPELDIDRLCGIALTEWDI
jgi:hypothetical protein